MVLPVSFIVIFAGKLSWSGFTVAIAVILFSLLKFRIKNTKKTNLAKAQKKRVFLRGYTVVSENTEKNIRSRRNNTMLEVVLKIPRFA